MPKQKVTEERYNKLKPIVDTIEPNTKGVGILYKSLNISLNTASRIRHSKDYSDYVDGKQQRQAKYSKPKQTEIIADEPANNKLDLPTELLLATLHYNSQVCITASAWAGNYRGKKDKARFIADFKRDWTVYSKNFDEILARYGMESLLEGKR